MTRREARELIMKMLFEASFHEDKSQEEILNQYTEEVKGKVKGFISEEFVGIHTHMNEIDTVISQHTEHWSLGRIAKVDLMLLRMAVYELKFGEDIPHNVAINEAIEIAKIYSTDKSPKFIHGILGKISKSLEV